MCVIQIQGTQTMLRCGCQATKHLVTTSLAAGNHPSYLFLEDTMENEYKHSLQRIEYGEEIRHDDCAFINIHESECPGQS